MGDNGFFASYYISKQITECIIDMVVFTYRSLAPGVAGVWTGYVLPVIRRILRHN